MADPFLPQQGGRHGDDPTAAAEPGAAAGVPEVPEQPDVILPPDGEAALGGASDDRVPARETTFRTPAGDSVDPADD